MIWRGRDVLMNTQTERPARTSGNSRGKPPKGRRYNKQTARVEARRDGKPLIFGWGTHLSHTDKVRIQRRATWGLATGIVLLLVAVLIGAWININIVIPGLPITTVNGHSIPQSEYRQMVGVKTQLEINKLYGPTGLTAQLVNIQKQDAQESSTITNLNTQISSLKTQISKLPKGSSTQRTTLTTQLDDQQKLLTAAQQKHQDFQNQITNLNQNTIPLEKQGFTQSQIANDSATWLQDDEILREWLATQNSALQTRINPTAAQVNRDINTLKADRPSNNGYNTFLSAMGIGDNTIRDMLTILDRRTNAQSYFASLLVSPSYQVLARQIVLPTQQKANQILQDLQKGQDFGKLAKADSQDTGTSSKGGDLGWQTRYEYIDSSAGGVGGSSVIDNWIFDPGRKLNETSKVLFGNGAYYIVQITGIDPSRVIAATTLSGLKSNALVDWLQDRRALPGQNITSPDQNKLLDTDNLPPNNILPTGAPSTTGTSTS